MSAGGEGKDLRQGNDLRGGGHEEGMTGAGWGTYMRLEQVIGDLEALERMLTDDSPDCRLGAPRASDFRRQSPAGKRALLEDYWGWVGGAKRGKLGRNVETAALLSNMEAALDRVNEEDLMAQQFLQGALDEKAERVQKALAWCQAAKPLVRRRR